MWLHRRRTTISARTAPTSSPSCAARGRAQSRSKSSAEAGATLAEQRLDGPPMDGKVAWITGGANGFGAGVARRLASLGAQVVVSDVDADNGEKVAAETGGTFVRCDVSSYDDNAAAGPSRAGPHRPPHHPVLHPRLSTGIRLGGALDPHPPPP